MAKYTTYGSPAFQLYKEGATLEEISEVLPVSVNSLSLWSIKYKWEKKRNAARLRSGTLHEVLTTKFHQGIQDISVEDLMGGGADSVAKVAAALSKLGGIDDFPSMVVTVMSDFAKFVSAADMRDEDKQLIMEAQQQYFESVKDHAFSRRR